MCVNSMGRLMMVYRHVKRACELKNILLVNFVCLLINLFFLVMQLNHGLWPIETFFQATMSPKDKAVMLDTFKVFINAMIGANVTYLAYGGTLIGSYRHHGFVPWDDDVDVMLNFTQKAAIIEALEKLKPQYGVYKWSEDPEDATQWKFYLDSSHGFVHKSFKWPYIDIFFFKENDTHVWDASPKFSTEYCWAKSDVFPLANRPFEDIQIRAPCNSEEVLKKNYKIDLCRSRQYSHMAELPIFTFNRRDVPCERLHHFAPFVHRDTKNGIVNETLMISNFVLQSVVIPSKCLKQETSNEL